MTWYTRFITASFLLVSLAVSAAPPPVVVQHAARSSVSYLYTDVVSGVQLTVPTGWRVRAETFNGMRQLRVVPPKADQRERAAIDVTVRLRSWRQGETLAGLAAQFRTQDGDREAAQTMHYLPKAGRLVLDYREGRYVSGRLWIVRRNLHIFQRKDRKKVLEMRCAANASEYKGYRKNLALLCYSAQFVKPRT
ncbi:hypothetical protein [Paludibacterium purpuratum]|uniref:Uncharacterized protein n=1 Tax=Paludibacterium purpuratum TaxID=1144873 RepID=A0A4R7B5C9_9NEIS|nr:hypothetical protein [Paludibacterium purpuratum]TDR79864.1 hypothetical protein DFP86_1063 [Paludibacterium purpuratum]